MSLRITEYLLIGSVDLVSASKPSVPLCTGSPRLKAWRFCPSTWRPRRGRGRTPSIAVLSWPPRWGWRALLSVLWWSPSSIACRATWPSWRALWLNGMRRPNGLNIYLTAPRRRRDSARTREQRREVVRGAMRQHEAGASAADPGGGGGALSW